MKKYIPVSSPLLNKTESSFVNDAMKKGAISGFFGEYIDRFEKEFSAYSDCAYGVSTTSGTTALHLALLAVSIEKGDEVLVSTLTNMATFFTVLYQGAKPIPVDIEEDTLNLDPGLLESLVTSRTKAIIVVHLFGHPVDMSPVIAFAKKHHLYIIEDCAQAHGALYKGKKTGSMGHIGCFSFYANKIITTGEGGMITTNDPRIAQRARSLKSLAFGDKNKFMHKEVGYNYRMTNLQAAVGCAQMGKIDAIIAKKRKIAGWYGERLCELDCLRLPVEKPYARNVYWMYHILLQERAGVQRASVMKKLLERGIETREGFIPYNMQEIFIKKGLVKRNACPRANETALRSFYLPSGPELKESDVDYVADNLKGMLKR